MTVLSEDKLLHSETITENKFELQARSGTYPKPEGWRGGVACTPQPGLQRAPLSRLSEHPGVSPLFPLRRILLHSI